MGADDFLCALSADEYARLSFLRERPAAYTAGHLERNEAPPTADAHLGAVLDAAAGELRCWLEPMGTGAGGGSGAIGSALASVWPELVDAFALLSRQGGALPLPPWDPAFAHRVTNECAE